MMQLLGETPLERFTYCYENGIRLSVRDVHCAKTVQDIPIGVYRNRTEMWVKMSNYTISEPLGPIPLETLGVEFGQRTQSDIEITTKRWQIRANFI